MNKRTWTKRIAILLVLGTAAAGGLWWRTLPNEQGNSGSIGADQTGGASAPLQASPESKQPVAGKQSDGSLLSFMILSDLHVTSANATASQHLREAFEDILDFDTKVEAIIMTGDLTDTATTSDYAEFRKIVNGYKLPPIYANMGNHDYYSIWMNDKGSWSKETVPNGKTDAESRERFMRLFGLEAPYSSATVKGIPFLLLSQEAYRQEKPEVMEGAWYSDTQLRWLKQRLAETPNGKPVFVMIHQPLPRQGQDGGPQQLIRAKEFRELLKPYKNVFVFSGHNHQDFRNGKPHYFKESFHLFNNSSVAQVLDSNYEYKDKQAAQGLYVQVYSRKVVIRGRDFANRMWLEDANWTIPLEKQKSP